MPPPIPLSLSASPPPPPPPCEEDEGDYLLHTRQGRRARTGTGSSRASSKPTGSPTMSGASSVMSPTSLYKTRSASELLSPKMRARMDPYPRYSPRKRLSADFSDATYSVGSGGDSPKSEKGGWRIFSAVHGPFLTGPLANDYSSRPQDFLSPRCMRKKEAMDFNNAGLLFPVAPDFVAPAISPEVFQAATATPPQQPQPEPDYSQSTAAPAGEYQSEPPPQNTQEQVASWDSGDAQTHTNAPPTEYQEDSYAEQYDSGYYGAQDGQGNTMTEEQYYAQSEQYYAQHGQYYQDQQAYTLQEQEYYAQQYTEYYAQQEQYAGEQGEYAGKQGEYSAVDQYNAAVEEPTVSPEQVMAASAVPTEQYVAEQATDDAAAPVEQAKEQVEHAEDCAIEATQEPASAHEVKTVEATSATTLTADETVSPKASTPAASSRSRTSSAAGSVASSKRSSSRRQSGDAFGQLAEGIADSMNNILSRTKDGRTHAEIELSCLIRKIQTQLKLMGRVSGDIRDEHRRTVYKLQHLEAEKRTLEATNNQLQQALQELHREREQFQQQLTSALDAKDARLKDAIHRLKDEIVGLKETSEESTSNLARELAQILHVSQASDLEKRVEEIRDVLDYLVDHQASANVPNLAGIKNVQASPPKPLHGSSRFEEPARTCSSWKSTALCAIAILGASLGGVYVGSKYGDHELLSQSPIARLLQSGSVKPSVGEVNDEVSSVLEPALPTIVEESDFIFEEKSVDVTPVDDDVVETVAFAEEPGVDAYFPVVEVDGSVIETSVESESDLPSIIVEEEYTDVDGEVSIDAVYESDRVVDHVLVEESNIVAEDTFVEVALDAEAQVDLGREASVYNWNTPLSTWDTTSDVSEEDDTKAIEHELSVEDFESEVTGYEVDEPLEVEDMADVNVGIEATVKPVVRSVTGAHKPWARAVYEWCPSLFSVPSDEVVAENGSSSPLNGLAKALTSLSTSYLPSTESVGLKDSGNTIVTEQQLDTDFKAELSVKSVEVVESDDSEQDTIAMETGIEEVSTLVDEGVSGSAQAPLVDASGLNAFVDDDFSVGVAENEVTSLSTETSIPFVEPVSPVWQQLTELAVMDTAIVTDEVEEATDLVSETDLVETEETEEVEIVKAESIAEVEEVDVLDEVPASFMSEPVTIFESFAESKWDEELTAAQNVSVLAVIETKIHDDVALEAPVHEADEQTLANKKCLLSADDVIAHLFQGVSTAVSHSEVVA